jgi:hypothetical protein
VTAAFGDITPSGLNRSTQHFITKLAITKRLRTTLKWLMDIACMPLNTMNTHRKSTRKNTGDALIEKIVRLRRRIGGDQKSTNEGGAANRWRLFSWRHCPVERSSEKVRKYPVKGA